jgi:hypothetical protein
MPDQRETESIRCSVCHLCHDRDIRTEFVTARWQDDSKLASELDLDQSYYLN